MGTLTIHGPFFIAMFCKVQEGNSAGYSIPGAPKTLSEGVQSHVQVYRLTRCLGILIGTICVAVFSFSGASPQYTQCPCYQERKTHDASRPCDSCDGSQWQSTHIHIYIYMYMHTCITHIYIYIYI